MAVNFLESRICVPTDWRHTRSSLRKKIIKKKNNSIFFKQTIKNEK